jgi:hypothetical protein
VGSHVRLHDYLPSRRVTARPGHGGKHNKKMEKRLLQEVMSQVQSRRQEERQKLEPEGRRVQRGQLELSSCRWRLRPLGGSKALSLEGTGTKQEQ